MCDDRRPRRRLPTTTPCHNNVHTYNATTTNNGGLRCSCALSGPALFGHLCATADNVTGNSNANKNDYAPRPGPQRTARPWMCHRPRQTTTTATVTHGNRVARRPPPTTTTPHETCNPATTTVLRPRPATTSSHDYDLNYNTNTLLVCMTTSGKSRRQRRTRPTRPPGHPGAEHRSPNIKTAPDNFTDRALRCWTCAVHDRQPPQRLCSTTTRDN